VGIDRIGPVGPTPFKGAPRARTSDGGAPPERAALDTPRDRIDLSREARDLAAAATPEERQAVVERLRDQVQDGTYHVDANGVAERMVNLGDV
jgi:negative regulator of flagellin synthesis FlgM